MFAQVFALLFLFFSASYSALADVPGAIQKTRFLRTVEAVSAEPVGVRTQFAAVALQQLALAHALEAQLAREELSTSTGKRKLRGWAAAVDRFARDLTQIAREIEIDQSVVFSVTHRGVLTIAATGRMIILTHPRHAQQSALEQSILKEFCIAHACEQFARSGSTSSAPIPVTTSVIKPAWNFTEDGYRCTHAGIELTFPASGSLGQQRFVCAVVMQEIMQLHDEVAWQIRHSVDVAWGDISVFATPLAEQHRVELNSAGDSVLLKLPVLAENRYLLTAAAQWLRKRLALAESDAQLRFDASDLSVKHSQ